MSNSDGTVLGAQVVAVLRFAEHAGVEARAASARRDVIRRAGERLPPRIADERRQALREAFLQTHLQRLVGGADAVLHPLDVAEVRIGPRAGRLRSIRVGDDGALVQIAEAIQLGPLVAHERDVEDQIRSQFVLRADVVLLDVGRALIGILCAAPHGLGDRARIEETRRIAVDQPERRGGRDRGGTRDARLQQVVDQVRRIEPEQPLAALPDGVRVEDPVSAAHDHLLPRRVGEPDARREVVAIGMDQRALEDAAVASQRPWCRSPDRNSRTGCPFRPAAWRTRSARPGWP